MPPQSSPPPAQDYTKAAAQDYQNNTSAVQTQTNANRADQSTPWANSRWTMNPNGQWTQSTGLNGPMSGMASSLENQAATNASSPFDNGTASGDQARTAAFSQEMSTLNPKMAQEKSALAAQLAAQGLSPGSAAYNAAMTQQAASDAGAVQSAQNNAIGLGNQEQAQTFGQNMQSRLMPMQELQGLQGFMTMPGYNAAGQAGPSNYMGAEQAQDQYGMQAWQTKMQQDADMMGAGAQMGGAILGAGGQIAGKAALSDERMKTNVHRLPVEAAPGIPLATFKYKHAPHKGHQLGVIAQDVERVRPDAVSENEGGIKHVDYSKLKPFGTR